MRYAVAKINENRKQMACRFYLADVLAMVAENTARLVGEGGKYTKSSLKDKIVPIKESPVEDALTMARALAIKMGLREVNG